MELCPVSYTRTTIIYGYFIAITFAESLGILNTRPSDLEYKQLSRDPANVNAWVIPVLDVESMLNRRCFNVVCPLILVPSKCI